MDIIELTPEQSNLAYSLARRELQAAVRETENIARERCDSDRGDDDAPCDRCTRAIIADIRHADAASLVSSLEHHAEDYCSICAEPLYVRVFGHHHSADR